ncbi:MAG: hypothetical protein ACKV2T_35915 [Kofleriaceae bacterium]
MRFAPSIAVAIGMLAAGAGAYADRRRCEVEFVRVPDDVRLVIESWLKAEPRCTGSIQLRVVPTDGGTYYLVAQRPDGRIHEREVPDAQSAGVLVASWVADDWTSDVPRDPEPEAAPVRMAPSDVPSVFAVMPPPTRAASPSSPGKWITLGVLLGADPERNGGFHLDIDLFRRGAWTFGLTGEYAESASGGDAYITDSTSWYASDWRLLVEAARTFRISPRLTLTGSFGLGLVHTETTVVTPMTDVGWEYVYQNVPQESAIADIGVMIARELGRSWALTAGPKVTLTQTQTHYLYSGEVVERQPATFMVLLGARYQL